jgi:hypothetical protein
LKSDGSIVGWGSNHWGQATPPAGNFSNLALLDQGQIDPGNNVVVEPIDPTTGESPAALTFSEVLEGGVTTVVSTSPSETHGPPSGFSIGNPPTTFNIETTATFTGVVQICLDYSNITYQDESTLVLFHFEDGAWVPISTSLDTENNIICGMVTLLSPFAVFESMDPIQLVEILSQQVLALNLQYGISNSLDAKLDTVLVALDDLNANNDVAAVNSLGAFISAVEAQRDKKIDGADADALIATAQEIINLIVPG